MLEPAIAHKEELLALFSKEIYTEEFMLYSGWPFDFTLPTIDDSAYHYRWAVVDEGKVIGYFAYEYWAIPDCMTNFGLYSFDRGNPKVGLDVFRKMDELVEKHHRVSWIVLSNNPVVRHYDKFCERHNGRKVVLHDYTKSLSDEFIDQYIYEIVKER